MIEDHLSTTTLPPIDTTVRASVRPLPFDDATVRKRFAANLARSLNPQTGLFDQQLRDGQWAQTQGTEHLTSTAICLIGIDRVGAAAVPLDRTPAQIFDTLVRATAEHGYAGAAGLLIWANALIGRRSLLDLLTALDLQDLAAAPPGFSDAFTTMELAWLLSGLAHEEARAPGPLARDLGHAVMRALARRQVPATSLFMQSSQRAPMRHRLRRRLSSFAEQIYPVQAAAFARLVGWELPPGLDGAAAARTLMSMQGSAGQWWWLYLPEHGEVAWPWPVFSVHQLSMAPMALEAAARAWGVDVSAAIERSRAWCAQTETGGSMWDETHGTVWRDVDVAAAKAWRIAGKGRALVTPVRPIRRPQDPTRYRINPETRPYEWGWWLYANSAVNGPHRERHLA